MRPMSEGEIELILNAIPCIPKTGFGNEVARDMLRRGKYKKFIWILLDAQKQIREDLEIKNRTKKGN